MTEVRMVSIRKGSGMVVLGLLVLLAAWLVAAPQAQAGDFGYRKPITIDRTKVGVSGTSTPTLTDYPFLYSVTDANLKSTANGGHVQIAISGNTATSNFGSGVGGTVSVSHIIPSTDTNRLLMVGISAQSLTSGGIPSVTSAVWDPTGANQALTLVPSCSVANPNQAANNKMWMYSLVNPATGTLTLTVTFSGGSGTIGKVVGVQSFKGVNQTTTLGTCVTAQGGSTTASVIVTSATGQLVMDTVAKNSIQNVQKDVSQTQLWKTDISGSTPTGGGSTKPGAASVTMQWTSNDVTLWAIGAVPINPVGLGWDIIFRAFYNDPVGSDTCGLGAGVSDCTLDHEIESYDPSTGTLVAWVRIPVLQTQKASNTYNTKIYIYYGNSNITLPTENPTPGVWDANYNAVWHLKENPAGTAPQMKDSTTNALHATSIGSMTLSEQVAGKINGSLSFNGTSNALNVNSFTLGPSFTVETWFNANDLSAGVYHAHMGTNYGFSDPKHRWLGTSGNNNTWDAVSTETPCSVGLTTGTWYHQVVTYDGSISRCYANGSLVLTSGLVSYSSVTDIFGLAYARPINGEFFICLLDEA